MPNLVVSITAPPKAGKTHLACTFPDPIKIYSFERGARFVASKFKNKRIDVFEFELPIVEDTVVAEHYATPIWEQFEKEYKKDVEADVYKTLVFDPATIVWAFCRQAITEEMNRKKILQVEYAKPNLKMASLFSRARIGGKNLVTIQYITDEYLKGEATGNKKMDGWKYTEGEADVLLEMMQIRQGNTTVMKTTIKDNRFDRSVNGKTLIDTDYMELVACLGV